MDGQSGLSLPIWGKIEKKGVMLGCFKIIKYKKLCQQAPEIPKKFQGEIIA